MRFVLTYSGLLPSSGSLEYKHRIRQAFHSQLARQWQIDGSLAEWARPRNQPSDPMGKGLDEISAAFTRGQFRFVPLVSKRLRLVCFLDILFLRREAPGELVRHGGDQLNSGRIRIAEQFEASASDMLAAVRQQQLEGVIGKRKDSLYEPGKRTGSWVKYRVNRGQELVIGGYIPGPHGFDSLIVGYYRGKDLIYVARVRNGFVQASRRQVFEKIRHLVSPVMPFANLPDTHKSRWGDELTAEKMKECVWLRPEAVAQIEFLEWTEADRLRHAKFAGLREDRDQRQILKEC